MNDKDRIAQLEAENKLLKEDLERAEREAQALYVKQPYRDPADDYRDDDRYQPGCGEYDTRDSKGRKLRPRVNEAGEPWWM